MKAFAVLTVLLVAAAAEAQLPTWKVSEMRGLDAGQWAAPAREGERSFRSARAGRAAVLTVPPWWGEGIRPPEGTVYVLEVTYRDTASQPVVFRTHAGVAGYWGMSEVHRFGGTGDGAWKTARVPVSWDLICRKSPPGDTTEMAIQANADLPVESVAVTLAGPEAAERYFSETRQWIARAQDPKRRSAGRGPREEPAIPAALKDSPIVPYVRSWMVPVFPNSAPQAGQAGSPVRIRMARNEYEPAAFAVYANGRALRNVTVRVAPLQSPGGRLTCQVDLRTAEYSAVQETVDYNATKDSGKYLLYPQRLWPAYPVDIEAGQSHLFWLTVHTLGDESLPGRYTGQADIEAEVADGGGKATASLPVEVEVLPVTLLTVGQAGLSLGNCTAGLPTLQEVATLVEHNHNRMDIWFGGTQPRMTVRDGKLSLDWTYMDDWMVRARKRGIEQVMWFLGGDPKGFPDTMNLERDLYRAQPGDNSALRREFLEKTNANPEKVIPGLRELYVDFVRQTAEHAKAAGWPGLILQPFDEPGKHASRQADNNPFHQVVGAGPWIQPHFKDCCALVRQGSRDVKVGLEAHVVEPCLVFLEDVDIFCTNRAWQVEDLPDRLRRAGVEFWQYANCDDQAPAHRTRYSFGFCFGGYGSKGALVWAYNFMQRFDTSGPGNWGCAWYTPFGTVFAPSLVGLREGLDDRRWMETCRARHGDDPAVKAMLEEIGKQAIAARAQTKYTSYNEATDPALMDQWRKRIMDTMAERAKGR